MSARNEAEKRYKLLKKEHSLPDLKDVEQELDIRIKEQPVLKALLSTMCDIVQSAVNHLFSVLEPKNALDVVEAGFYSDNQKKELALQCNDWMSLLHVLVAGLYSEEDEQARIINNTLKTVISVKSYMKEFSLDQAKKWKKSERKTINTSHFG